MLVQNSERGTPKRPQRKQLSFELSEMLHMLEALEGAQLGSKPDDAAQTA
jgi:hypothetical protein